MNINTHSIIHIAMYQQHQYMTTNNNDIRTGGRIQGRNHRFYWPLIVSSSSKAIKTTTTTLRGSSSSKDNNDDDIDVDLLNSNDNNDDDTQDDESINLPDDSSSESSTESVEHYLHQEESLNDEEKKHQPKTNGEVLGATTTTAAASNPDKKHQQPKRKQRRKLFSFIRFINNIFYAMTQPFPDLRKLSRKRNVDDEIDKDDNSKQGEFAISLRLRDGITALLLYLSTGVISYHYFFEKWSIIDSLYFTCVCFSTVGYGDIAPQTDAGKLFTCIFGIVGIALLGAAVATIGSRLVKAEIDAARVAREQGRKKLIQVYDQLPHVKKKATREPEKQEEKHSRAKEAARAHLPEIRLPRKLFPPGVVTVLNAIRTILQSLFVVAVGGLVIGKFEGWSISNSLYYSLITASTIGLGDLAPTTKAGRLAAVLVIPMSVAAAGEILANIGLAIVERRQKFIFDNQLKAGLTEEYLKAMDADGNGKVDREEYVLFMLMEMGLVNDQEIQELRSQFDRLDATSNGYLDHEDLVLMSKLRGAGLID